jgi:hypothetical protein
MASAAEAAFNQALNRTPEERAKEIAEAEEKALKAALEQGRKEVLGAFPDEAASMPKGGASGKRRRRRMTTAKRFCSCVKKVKSAKKTRTEGSAIAICTSSLLWPHGKTLHSVSCRRKNHLKTQKRKK